MEKLTEIDDLGMFLHRQYITESKTATIPASRDMRTTPYGLHYIR